MAAARKTTTTTQKAHDFLAEPIKTKDSIQDLPALGPASEKVLAKNGIKNTRQLLGHWLKVGDDDEFIESLKEMGVAFTKSGNLEDPEAELLNTLKEKWEFLSVRDHVLSVVPLPFPSAPFLAVLTPVSLSHRKCKNRYLSPFSEHHPAFHSTIQRRGNILRAVVSPPPLRHFLREEPLRVHLRPLPRVRRSGPPDRVRRRERDPELQVG
jgi:Barrier to autointegration factor